jgi:hypothetical protein
MPIQRLEQGSVLSYLPSKSQTWHSSFAGVFMCQVLSCQP